MERSLGPRSAVSTWSSNFLWLLYLTFLIAVSNCRGKITCMKSPGDTVSSETCEGDYCLFAEMEDMPHPVRGCLTGDMLKGKIPDECEFNPMTKRHTCLCSKPGCNVDSKTIVKQNAKIRKCFKCAKHKGCSRENMCFGESCTITKYPNGTLVRGCSDDSTGMMPLFAERGYDSCISPAFPSHNGDSKWDPSSMQAVTCSCNDKDFCNARLLYTAVEKLPATKQCKVKAAGNVKKVGEFATAAVPDCSGEHCFTIWVETGQVTGTFSGCLSYFVWNGTQRREHGQLHDHGCLNLESETLRIKACIDEKAKGGHTSTTSKTTSRPSREDYEGYTVISDTNEGLENEAGPKASEEEEHAKAKENVHGAMKVLLPQRHHAIHVDEDLDNPPLKPKSEGNTAIVAVFVAIMVAIVIAGVVWKFELHKKIFHSRYQTVAG